MKTSPLSTRERQIPASQPSNRVLFAGVTFTAVASLAERSARFDARGADATDIVAGVVEKALEDDNEGDARLDHQRLVLVEAVELLIQDSAVGGGEIG